MKNAESGRFKFEKYDAAELARCADAFLADIDRVYRPGPKIEEPATEEWTEFVLDWFADAAAPGLLVDGRRSDTRANWKLRWPQLDIPRRQCAGEFMVDLAHSTYPGYELSVFKKGYWEKAVSQDSLEVMLALESEWGRQNQKEATLCAVMADAIKLAAIRARVKVMIYGCQDLEHEKQIRALLIALKKRSRDNAAWLCVGVPWKAPASGSWGCATKVLP